MVLPMPKLSTISCASLLLCERREIAQFAQGYIQYLRKKDIRLPQFQLVNFWGIEKLSSLARQLQAEKGSGSVQRIIILADAQADLEERRKKLETVRGSEYFAKVPDYAYYLFPGRLQGKRWRQGYLEDLLLQTLRMETADGGELVNLLNVSREYLLSVNNYRREKLSNPSRNLLYAYLAATEKYVGLNLPDAIKLNAFDLEHESFACLRQCLEKV